MSRPVTAKGLFTKGIEGPASPSASDLFVVNFKEQGTIGRIPIAGNKEPEIYVKLPKGSIGNAIRFDRDGRMFVADYKKHNILEVVKTPDGKMEARILFTSPAFHQPNDLTTARDGTLYASDPFWKKRTGKLWKISRTANGEVVGTELRAKRKLGPVNGIDLSPDDQTLFVSESFSREIWSYQVAGDELKDPKLVIKFKDFDVDGLRVDQAGRIFVTRIEKGTIAIVRPDGSVEREVATTAKEPTNLAFGGSDGKTVFVTQRAGGYVESFRAEHPGREWCLLVVNHAHESCSIKR